ncbi:hypothetical protein FNV43_RR25402 [Rhamnella rubrinervis]|uniref:F-box domain-containing protein n=1 Tax=Rhamnella rubrinervis TaxID=2594499 RepID=A0A8K0DUH6_9ROSA|nr:hypothetical protein FNV43_RR25402 [Rhamnella rubrinervis]
MANDVKDRISNLPSEVIHHILSFVPMDDIVRMSCLSKHWRFMWICIPVLNFEEFADDCFIRIAEDSELWSIIDMFNLRGIQQQTFVKFVDKILDKRRKASSDEELNVTRFKLYLDHLYGFGVRAAQIDNWLNSALEMRVKELNLCIKPYFRRPLDRIYRFPQSALNNARSVTVLKFEGIRLKTNFPISLPSLTTLSVINVILDDKTFQNLISGCPNIKDLLLSGYKEHEEGAYGGSLSCVNLTVCVALRSLSLHDSDFTNQWLEHLTFGLPYLRDLLWIPVMVQKFKHPQPKPEIILLFGDGPDEYESYEMKVALNTPNLVYFDFRGDMSFRFSINSANLLEANLIVWSDYGVRSMYFNLLSLLSNLNCSCSTTVRLHVNCEEAVLIPKCIREMCFSPLPDLKHLKVKIHKDEDFSTKSELREALRWNFTFQSLVTTNEEASCTKPFAVPKEAF